MKKSEVVQRIFSQNGYSLSHLPAKEKGLAFAPTNIALCKYWGKRDGELNLPHTSSLSVALPDKGTFTSFAVHDLDRDIIILNEKEILPESPFAKRLQVFLNLFRPENNWHLKIDIKMNIPLAAGLASSASGFAALTLALADLFAWELSKRDLSILARLGSGSAARSFWRGFVEWHAGVAADGMDSFAEPLSFTWDELCIGILCLNANEKAISSREAMQRTVNSSFLYAHWPKKVAEDLVAVKDALQAKNFSLLGSTVESNALTMHATMLLSSPPICYFLPETIAAMHKVWQLRQQGFEIYFTQDAGPNLKLLFLECEKEKVKTVFPDVEVIRLFESK